MLQAKPMHEFMIWHTVKKYARQAGLQVDRLYERGICAHSTRVTAITASFEGGAKLEEIQQLVGHKDRGIRCDTGDQAPRTRSMRL